MGVSERHCSVYREKENFTALNVTSKCPLVLLVKLGWEQSKVVCSEDGKVM